MMYAVEVRYYGTESKGLQTFNDLVEQTTPIAALEEGIAKTVLDSEVGPVKIIGFTVNEAEE